MRERGFSPKSTPRKLPVPSLIFIVLLSVANPIVYLALGPMEEDGDWVMVRRPTEKDLWEPSLIQTEPSKPLEVRFNGPAKHWTDAVPLGNGRLGAMVWGGVQLETLNLNGNKNPQLSPIFFFLCYCLVTNKRGKKGIQYNGFFFFSLDNSMLCSLVVHLRNEVLYHLLFYQFHLQFCSVSFIIVGSLGVS